MKQFTFLLLFIVAVINADAQFTWINKGNFPDSARSGAGCFTVNGKGYMIGGRTSYSPVTLSAQNWQYDPTTDSWQRKADFPRTVVGGAYFSIGSKGYFVSGGDVNANYSTTTYEYDPVTDNWTTKAPFPGNGIAAPFQFTINGIGYIGAGVRNDSTYGTVGAYAFNPVANTWTSIARYPGSTSLGLCGFAIDSFGYAGLGENNKGVFYTQLYRYDPAHNIWSQMASFPGKGRFSNPVAFVLNGKAYVGAGFVGGYCVSDIYCYDPVTNQWSNVPGVPGLPFMEGTCFSFNNSAVLVAGYNIESNKFYKNVSQFASCGTVMDTMHIPVYDTTYVSISVTDTLYLTAHLTGISSPANTNLLKVFPNPAKDHLYIDCGNYGSMSGYTIRITNMLGQDVYSSPVNQQLVYIDLSTWTGVGTYTLSLADPQQQVIAVKKILIQ